MGQPSRHGYRVTRPIGNCADKTTTQSVDVFGAQSGDQGDQGDTWTQKTRVTNYKSNPNYEQFDNRAVPFAGDSLWVTSLGDLRLHHLDGLAEHRRGLRSTRGDADPDQGNADVPPVPRAPELDGQEGQHHFLVER